MCFPLTLSMWFWSLQNYRVFFNLKKYLVILVFNITVLFLVVRITKSLWPTTSPSHFSPLQSNQVIFHLSKSPSHFWLPKSPNHFGLLSALICCIPFIAISPWYCKGIISLRSSYFLFWRIVVKVIANSVTLSWHSLCILLSRALDGVLCWLIGRSIGLLVYWFTGWLVGWLVYWLIDGLFIQETLPSRPLNLTVSVSWNVSVRWLAPAVNSHLVQYYEVTCTVVGPRNSTLRQVCVAAKAFNLFTGSCVEHFLFFFSVFCQYLYSTDSILLVVAFSF